MATYTKYLLIAASTSLSVYGYIKQVICQWLQNQFICLWLPQSVYLSMATSISLSVDDFLKMYLQEFNELAELLTH